MPGLIVFNRRWSVASDDLVIPAASLLIIHLSWLVALSIVLAVVDSRDWRIPCMTDLFEHTIGYLIILIGCSIVEVLIIRLSLKGTIMDTRSRDGMAQLIYIRTAIFLVELVWLIIGVVWIIEKYDYCTESFAKESIVAVTVSNWIVLICVLITVWCTFDSAGRSWLKMKRFNDSLRSDSSKYHYRRSSNSFRNWRHRKAVREYNRSWNRRCKLLCCCLGPTGHRNSSLNEVAKILSEFFRDIDIVPSDIVAGLVILRKKQKMERSITMKNKSSGVFQYLSGVGIGANTRFMDVTSPKETALIENLIYYLHYAMAGYGWPFVLYSKSVSCVDLCPYLHISPTCPLKHCFPSLVQRNNRNVILGDTSCFCNEASLQLFCQDHDFELIYANFCNRISEPPFFVAIDYRKRSIVISIRGTLSLEDILTDLNASEEILPLNPLREDWFTHKGILEAAVNIKQQLEERGLIEQALSHSFEKGSNSYDLVIVGHSLGGGTAAILALLLKESYPSVKCYAFAPPGGLMSQPVMEYSKSFVTSLVLGKDVVTRLGLHQMEELRSDLLHAIAQCNKSKWKVISASATCFRSSGGSDEEEEGKKRGKEEKMNCSLTREEKSSLRSQSLNPDDERFSLTVHKRLFPPGNIIHIVRNHPEENQFTTSIEDGRSEKNGNPLHSYHKKEDVVFQALYVDNRNFDEILISPTMFQDHLPDHQLSALEQLLTKMGPPKPERRKIQNGSTCTPIAVRTPSRNTTISNNYSVPTYCSLGSLVTPDSLDTILTANGSSNRVLLETSFTDLRPGTNEEVHSPLRCKSKSNSIRPSLLSALKYHGKTDVLRDHRHVLRSCTTVGSAPLATPESLSETSSIRSRSSLSLNLPEQGEEQLMRDKTVTRAAPVIERSLSRGTLNTGLMEEEVKRKEKEKERREEKEEEKERREEKEEKDKRKEKEEKGKRKEKMEKKEMEKECPNECDLESFATKSEFSLEDLMDAFSGCSGKTSPSSSFKDTTKHVTFDPFSTTSITPSVSSFPSSSSFSRSHSSFCPAQTVIEFEEQ